MASHPNSGHETEEKEYEWHPLPMMIGQSINDDHDICHSGGYAVTRTDNDTIKIYEIVDMASSANELDHDGDRVEDMHDYVIACVERGSISPPPDGWASETEMLPESIFAGYE